MPRGIWDHPGLREFTEACLAEGKTNGDIRRLIQRELGLSVPASAIYHFSKRYQARAEQPVEELTAPVGGWATSVTQGPRHAHAKGWEPRVEIEGYTGFGITDVTQQTEGDLDEDELIRGWGLSPEHWRIVQPLGVNKWQTSSFTTDPHTKERIPIQVWNYQYKAKLVRREAHPDLVPLIDEIREHQPTPKARPQGHQALVVCLSDWQLGKGDGDGVSGTVARILGCIDSVETHIEKLRGFGYEIGDLYVFGIGDLIESCDGHYPQQAFRSELNLRDQVKVVRRLILKALERWAPLFDRVVVGCVGGNHGEHRRDGKSYTDFADNHDVSVFEQVSEIMAANQAAYGHVSFAIPKDDLSLTFDVHGVVVGIAHGHTARGGSGIPQKRILDWWAKQAHGCQPVGDATILITGHYHHFSVVESGRKVHIQCPAMEGGSDWWRNTSGQESRPGMLTLVVGKDVSPAGYAAIEVL